MKSICYGMIGGGQGAFIGGVHRTAAAIADAAATRQGVTARGANGETLTAPKIDSINTFAAPTTVSPVPYSVRASGGRLTLRLPPKSITVVEVQQ